ncbi:MAG: helix-turn-helix domain-containing protein [Oscillospiraceae bacterium]|nr:helix-turn-helix domain-containing protein [Oscillospiraceae bacterium]
MPQKIFDPINQPFLFFRSVTANTKDSPLTPYHRHDAYEIFLFLSGNRKMCIENSCVQCRPGDMFIISPDQLHAGLCDEDCEYDRIVINIKKQFLDELSRKGADLNECFKFESINQIKYINLGMRDIETVIEIYERFQQSRTLSCFGQSLLTETYITQLLIFINQWFLSKQGEKPENLMPSLVSNVITYIHKHLTEDITLEGLEQAFFFSGRYISKCFKQHTGITVRSYILDQRITLAKKLLNKGCNVSEACYQSGFSDYANFIRSFTNYVGVSPGKYAKQVMNKAD